MVQTRSQEELKNITAEVESVVHLSGIRTGVCVVYVPHTTAGITINENADPSVKNDMLMALKTMVPDSLPYTHAEGNSPAHVKASLMGSSVQILIERGRLVLGTWQGVYFCEFDGPRTRRVHVACRT
ncbi:MAG: secondary thiamine-phosphate synthase enzyme YjbQ [Candidatus Aminicenantaceae bacterium]